MKPKLILVVEDNPADVNLIEEAISEEGLDCTLKVLRDGTNAIEEIARIEHDASTPCPDLLLLDLNVPRVSGEDILKRVRRTHRCNPMKVLVVSSSPASVDRDRVMNLGATDYFRKPSTLDEFLRLGPKVRELLK